MTNLDAVCQFCGTQVEYVVVRNPARAPKTRMFDGSELEKELLSLHAGNITLPVLSEFVKLRLEKGIHREIIAPFIERSEALSKEVLPTLNALKKLSEQAHTRWTDNIWKTAWTGSLALAGTLLCFAIVILYIAFDSHAERKTAEAIHEVTRVMSYNQEAFIELTTARARIRLLKTQDDSGHTIPGGYVPVLRSHRAGPR